jgi:hypothetical protein
MAKYPNITHLKQGKTFPDPIATAKVQGVAFSDTAKHVEHPTVPDPKGADGHLGGKNTPDRN